MLNVARVFKYTFFTLRKSCCSAIAAKLPTNTSTVLLAHLLV